MSEKKNEPRFFLEPIETKEARVLARLLRYDRADRVAVKLTTALRPDAGKRDLLAFASTVADTIDLDPDRAKGAAVRDGARARGAATRAEAAQRRKEFRRRADELRRQNAKWTDWHIADLISAETGRRWKRRTIYAHIHQHGT